jgi:hypothetical protein
VSGLRLWRFPVLFRGIVGETGLEGFNIAVSKHWGQFAMERYARKFLQPAPIDGSVPPAGDVHFLTGYIHAYQTAFCAYSLQLCSPAPVRIIIHDDGTLDDQTRDQLHRALPLLTIRSLEEDENHAAEYLPAARFPTLWNVRSKFVLMRKLMDVHGSAPGWKMFLDSDMLFFNEPVALLDWLRDPQSACCMEDIRICYGYPDQELSTCLGGHAVPEFVNTGMCGLNREAVDWERLEHWCKYLSGKFGVNHFLEQCLTALLFGEMPFFKFPRRDYITCPMREQVVPVPEGAMHHYVSDSRKYLYMFGWRTVLKNAQRPRTPLQAGAESGISARARR